MAWRELSLRTADGIDRVVARICEAVILIVGTVLLAMLAGNVLARYALDSGGFRFAQELPERLFPVLIMAGVVLGVQKGAHAAVETVLFLLPGNGARLMLVVGHIIIIASYLILAKDIVALAEMVWVDRSPVMGIPAAYGYYAIAIGFALVVIVTATLAVKVALIGPEAMPVPAPEEQIS